MSLTFCASYIISYAKHRYTEPGILILILLNAVVLTIQTYPSSTLPTAEGLKLPPRIKGYFHSWEDYVLFALFIVFTCVPSLFHRELETI